MCGGPGPEPYYNCQDECIAGFDCNNVCGGTETLDECGVCGGSGTGIYEDCEGNCVQNLERDCNDICGGSATEDDCGVCGGNNSSCSGCTDPLAMNYNPNTTVSDGSCEYPLYGCMDPDALNYNPTANFSNASCNYEPEVGFWFGDIDE